MRNIPLSLLRNGLFTWIGLLALTACASTQSMEASMTPQGTLAEQGANARSTPARFMALGAPAAPPLGYLNFCSRRPDQCGLDASADAQGEATAPKDRARQLYAKYYWPVVYGEGVQAPAPVPTSDQQVVAAAPAETAPAGSTPASSDGGVRTVPSQSAAESSGSSAATGDAETASSFDRSLLEPAAYMTRTDAVQPQGSSPSLLEGVWRDEVGDDPYDRFVQASPRASQPANDVPQAAASASPPPTTDPAAAPAPSDPTRLDATRALTSMLSDVNLQINGAIRYIHDGAQYGREDYWTLPLDAGGSGAGDCKDYVLEKRRALIARGVPAAAMSIAIVDTRWGETHAVLLVSTDRGELVLDSLSPWVLPWTEVNYRWIERQAPGQQLIWVRVDS